VETEGDWAVVGGGAEERAGVYIRSGDEAVAKLGEVHVVDEAFGGTPLAN